MTDFREACAAQILRLHGTKGYPLTTQGLKDLVDALESAGSETTATAIIDQIKDGLERGDWCPTAAEIRRKAERERPTQFGCSKCDGTGWRQVEDAFTLHSKGVRRCECRRAVPA